jgi:hypothetical protein
MPIEMAKTDGSIQFRIVGEMLEQLNAWEYSNDEMVFREQLTTGSFHGRLSVDEDLMKMMKMAAAEGKILPYYGAGGSRGVCSYEFRPMGSRCIMRVEHPVTNTLFELFEDNVVPVGATTAKHEFVLTIEGTEYEKLEKWDRWVEENALAGTYTYRFGTVSFGKGFGFSVTDTETETTIDITDYESW